MNRHYFLILSLFFSMPLFAQTGIGTTNPDASAKLDVSATNKGFLPPRVSLTSVTDNTTISSPATGLLVYCKGDAGLAAGYYYWNGNAWATIATTGGSGSVAAEFGSQILQAGVTINSATPIDVISFTLPSSGTWEVITFLRAQGTAGYAAEFAVYDNSNNLVPNSEILPAYGQTGSTGTGIVRITTSGSATYKVKAWASGGASYPFNVTTDGNGRTGVTWKKISGNAPVTGQSVDYVSVGSIYLTGVGGSQDLIFPTNYGGNIPYNTSTGVFTLSANKTYLFQAQVRVNNPSAGGNYIEYGFVDAVSNALLVNGTQTITSSSTSTAGYGSNPVINFIYTPSSNQTVKIRTTSNTVGTQTVTSGTANITQIGSSAIVNPWTLSGTNTYNTTGNVGIGNSSPTTTLDVTGSLQVSGNTTLKSNLNIGTGVGAEGGEIQLVNAVTGSTLSGTAVSVDIYQDRLRIFEGGGNNRGVFLDLAKAPSGVGGELTWKASGIVNPGTYVALDNIKATLTSSGTYRGLSIAAVSTSFTANISAHYAMNGGANGGANFNNAITTTPTSAIFGWGFGTEGDGSYYNILDKTNNRFYRITLMIGAGYNNNFISIERLY
jgi:hypothetical protein